MTSDIFPMLLCAAKLAGQVVPLARHDAIREHLAMQSGGASAAESLRAVWRVAGLEGAPNSLLEPKASHCPFLLSHPDKGWLLAISQAADGAWVVQDAAGTVLPERLPSLAGAVCVGIPPKPVSAAVGVSTAGLVWGELWRRKWIFSEALLATFLVNLLALASSLYSMQVYDRVIPSHGFQTLYVLSFGVVAAILFELVLKHVRGIALDKTAMRIDIALSEWFFSRAMGIRLDCRPPFVGTMAAQIRGFEMVRGVLASSSMFVLADVPFAALFVIVIFMVGGSLAWVLLLFIPISVLTGLMFQRKVNQYTKANQGQANFKAGLLVESIDGAESLKANGADWKLLARWNTLSTQAAESDERIRHYSALSQHLTSTLSQLGYVAMVALGSYMVAENTLTMGGLIACTIISGRALMPIAQLPNVMVQWSHARTAMNGLDKLIALPNEADDRAHALIPGKIDARLEFDRCQFFYGSKDRTAIELGVLKVDAGETVGIVGGVGTGKSTLLKLASGLYRPGEGRVLLGGIDMAMIAPQFLRETIAYLPQQISLISGSLRDNLLQGLPDPGDEALLEAARLTGLIDLINSHPRGLALPIMEGGRGISGGQKQLIGMTRIVLAPAAIILLDEPTAAMDSVTEAKVVALLKGMAAKGATLIVATHKTALLPVLDRLWVIKDRQVILDGARDQVLARMSGNSSGKAAP